MRRGLRDPPQCSNVISAIFVISKNCFVSKFYGQKVQLKKIKVRKFGISQVKTVGAVQGETP